MISVCIATYNGEHFLREQLDSILPQLGEEDEVIVSDDGSTDATFDILNSYSDARIRLLHNVNKGFVHNFENALNNAKGDYIFLSDQDDVWFPNKVQVCISALQKHIAINHNSVLVNSECKPLGVDFFSQNRSGAGYWRTLWRNSYSGCCMAFRRELLDKALPFPPRIASHDIWLGLIAEKYGKPLFISEPLLYYRRHGHNVSSTAEKSGLTFMEQLRYRLYMFLFTLIR